MGIVFNKKVGFGYNKLVPCHKLISQQRALRVLTPQNLLLLKTLGLKVTSRAKRRK